MSQETKLSYEEVISRVTGDEFFSLFERLKAEPRWVNSNGKPSIQLLGLCHAGSHHSALFDPTTCKVHCFSECGCGMYLHTWVGKVTEEYVPENVRDELRSYFLKGDTNLTARPPREGVELGFTERPFERHEIAMVPGIPKQTIEEIRIAQGWRNDLKTLKNLVWCTEDKIDPEILQEFDVAYRPPLNLRTEEIDGRELEVCSRMGTIILPHHNAAGEIVGLYERSFDTLRREAKQLYGDWMTWSQIAGFPRAKYVPLLKLPEHMTDDGKTSYSFPNSSNLYGLHKAAKAIRETGKAIVFEGAKSVMLAHQWGRELHRREWETAVASHTFGAHVNHINMLMDAGATEIYLGFDKQYQKEEGEEWALYDRKTRELAEKVYAWRDSQGLPKTTIKIYRLRDKTGALTYKDAPVDKGPKVFEEIFASADEIAGEDAPEETKFNVAVPDSAEWAATRAAVNGAAAELLGHLDKTGQKLDEIIPLLF